MVLASVGVACRAEAVAEPPSGPHELPVASDEAPRSEPTLQRPIDAVDAPAETAEIAEPDIAEATGLVGPPEPRPVVPVEVPFDRRAGVTWPLSDGFDVVLFADEKAAIRRRTAEQLAARGRRLVPFDELERIETAAAQGRLVLEDDRRCVAALTRQEVRSRYFPDNPRVVPSADCFADCRLSVSASRGEGEQWTHLYGYSSGPVRRPTDPRAWTKAKLRPVEALMGGVIGGVVGGFPTPPMRLGVVQSIGPWSEAPGSLDAMQGSVARCVHPDPRPEVVYEVRMEVQADGRIGRCEASSEDTRAHSRSAECLCEVLGDVRYPKGRLGRRLRLSATDDGRESVFGFVLEGIQVGTESWVTRIRESGVVPACVDRSPPPGDFEGTIVLGLEPGGEVRRAEIFGQIDTPAEIGFAQCLVHELPSVPLPCAPPGVDVLQIRIRPETSP